MNYIRWEKFFDAQLIIFTPFAIFYCYVLIMLITSKQKLLKSSYFVIVIYVGIVDITLFFGDQFNQLAQRLGLGPSFEILSVISINITGLNFSLHVFGNFLKTLCQYTAVCWPHAYNKLWTLKRTLFYLFLTTLITVFAYRDGWEIYNIYRERQDGSYSVETVTPKDSEVYIFASVQVVLYVFTAYFLLWRIMVKIQTIGIGNSVLRRHHKGLALVTFADSLFFCLDLLYEIESIFRSHFYPKWFEAVLHGQFENFYAVMYLSNAVFLVLFSRISREEVFRPFRRDRTVVTYVGRIRSKVSMMMKSRPASVS